MINSERLKIAAGTSHFGKKSHLSFMAIQMICIAMTISSLFSQNKSAILTQQKIAILSIPIDMLSCGFCLETLDSVIDSLNNYSYQAIIWGIVTDSNNNKTFSDSTIAVTRKQIHGLIIGRSIKFPIILDINTIFAKSAYPALIILSTENSPFRIDLLNSKNIKFYNLLHPE
jgi:hypothetical protein